MALTTKQELFIREYLVDSNATRAAKEAGYSQKTAYSIGEENLRKPEILARIQEITDERFKRLDITVDMIVEEYRKIGMSNIKNYLSYKTAMTRVGVDEDGKDIFDYAPIINLKDSDEVDGAPIAEVSVSREGVFKFKLHDKKGALDSLARHKGMFIDNVNHTGNMVIFNGESELTD